MNGGIMAATCLIAVFVFFETILPRFIAALRHAHRKDAAAREADAKTTQMSAPSVPVQGPESSAAVRSPLSSARDGVLDAGHGDGEEGQWITDKGQSPRALVDGRSEGQSAADRLWAEARALTHNFIPDPSTDADYLAKLHGAANLGHLVAMAKLGDYAFRRNALVEAYYWTALANLKGATGLDEPLRQIETCWMSYGFPTEYENVYTYFSEEQGSFARALLRIRCAVDAPSARARMRELAEQGCHEAWLFLKRQGGREERDMAR